MGPHCEYLCWLPSGPGELDALREATLSEDAACAVICCCSAVRAVAFDPWLAVVLTGKVLLSHLVCCCCVVCAVKPKAARKAQQPDIQGIISCCLRDLYCVARNGLFICSAAACCQVALNWNGAGGFASTVLFWVDGRGRGAQSGCDA